MVLESAASFVDNNWHNLIFSRETDMVKLVVDEDTTGQKVTQIQKIDIEPPFFIGGLNPDDHDKASASLVNNFAFKN